MSGECDDCGEHTLECVCGPFFRRRQNGLKGLRKRIDIDDTEILSSWARPPQTKLSDQWIKSRKREDHEDLLRDPQKCESLGLDRLYEIIVYLKRWGCWLGK